MSLTTAPWRVNVVSLFPEMLAATLAEGVVGQAIHRGLIQLEFINPRDFTEDEYHRVDDRPFGGGDGMVMLAEPVARSLDSIRPEGQKGRVIALSPHGRLWSQELAGQWAERGEPVTLLCGRYAGFDQRLIANLVDEEISIGDFVLSGGELAAAILIDSVGRLLPGVLGNPLSAVKESFSQGLLECPQFTRPRDWRGHKVPEALLSGHHGEILRFRNQVEIVLTALRRPDLMNPSQISSAKGSAQELAILPDEELRLLGLSRGLLNDFARGSL